MTSSRPRHRLSGTDLALVASFAALVAVCAVLPSIRLAGPVPITLQTFAVLLCGAVLGARRGFLAALLYLAVGSAGLPVFAGGAGGLGVLAGPSAGYLVSYPLAAGLCGLLVQRFPRRVLGRGTLWVFAAAMVSSALAVHGLGTTGLVLRADMTWGQAFDVDKVFWLGDTLKNVAVALVATAVHRAFPDLLDRRPVPADEVAEPQPA